MDYEKLKEVIAKQIKENGRGEITGPVLQAVLMAMVDSLGEVYPQTYTAEQKAQARANIDALANYDGEITKEKLSAEVQAILNDVANKQNITDESLATIAKTIVGAINEVYKGGLEDASIATDKIADTAVTEDKLAQSIQDTLNKVGTNVKIINEDIDLNNIKEDGLYLLSAGHKYTNYPLSDGTVSAHYALLNSAALLIVSHRYTQTQVSQVVLSVSKSYLLPLIRTRSYDGTNWFAWNDDYMYKTYNDAANSLNKYQDFLTDTEVNNIWDNN